MGDPCRIAVLDSGVGGLSVLAAIREKRPACRYFYVSDNANYPYGIKEPKEVVACVTDVALRLCREAAPDILVIACNTASTVTLPSVRALVDIPVVGVVPAIKPAAAMTRTGTIGLLATPGTVTREYTGELIASFAAHRKVIRHGTRELVDLAEAKLRGEKVDVSLVAKVLSPMFEAGRMEEAPERRLDTVVLGCTHFPLLADELAEAAPWPVRWLDSGTAIAERVSSLLKQVPSSAPEVVSTPSENIAYFTRLDEDARALGDALASLGLTKLAEL